MDRETVERAMGGDHAAFAELARRSIDRLYATARLITREDALAQDAVQEALVSAWRHIGSLRDPDRFEAWIYRLLVNSCRRELRRGHRQITEIQMPDSVGHEPDPGELVADTDQLERGFRRLDPDQRAVMVLHYYLGHPLTEIAEILDLPPGTVKSRLHRATRSMRAALDADARAGAVAQGRLA